MRQCAFDDLLTCKSQFPSCANPIAVAGSLESNESSGRQSSMCQLFGLSCNTASSVTVAFTGLSARGGRTGEHSDGFGLAFHDGVGCRLFIDENRASDSALAVFLRRLPIRAGTVLAHVRKATQGPVQLANCHPFLREWGGRYWSFCHNGNLLDFSPRLNGIHLPVGNTDSERAFCWLLQQLRERFRTRPAEGWRAFAPVLAELADQIARFGTFNFLLSGRSSALCLLRNTVVMAKARAPVSGGPASRRRSDPRFARSQQPQRPYGPGRDGSAYAQRALVGL
jgi:predicted glutamine amidotransferase